METRGRFGITRDADGSLSVLWAWPWYWRYPSGIAILALALWIAATMPPTTAAWKPISIAACGTLLALGVMYELGCLSIVAAIGWGVWALITALFPSSLDIPLSAKLFLVGAAIAYTWFVAKTAMDAALRNERATNAVNARVGQLESKLDFNLEETYSRVAALERRMHAVDGKKRPLLD